MGSGVNFNILAGFKAIDAWQRNIVRNAQGMLTPGYNYTQTHFGHTASGSGRASQTGTGANGGRNGMAGGGDTLAIGSTSLQFEQGTIDPAYNPTSLAIRGSGFFLVAENLNPGARLFLTRNGEFHYDAQGRLVNQQGLFVVGGNGTLTDPPVPVTDPGDGTVDLPQITLGKVDNPGNLLISGYGSTVYALTEAAGPLRGLPNGRPEVGFVQPSSREMINRAGYQAALLFESNQATQTYKILKDMLDNYNRAVDDAINTVK